MLSAGCRVATEYASIKICHIMKTRSESLWLVGDEISHLRAELEQKNVVGDAYHLSGMFVTNVCWMQREIARLEALIAAPSDETTPEPPTSLTPVRKGGVAVGF